MQSFSRMSYVKSSDKSTLVIVTNQNVNIFPASNNKKNIILGEKV